MSTLHENDHRRRPTGFVALLCLALLCAVPAHSAEPLTLVLATVPTSSERIQILEGHIPDQRPGWFVELSRRAAKQCGVDVDFVFMPWARALKMVEQGHVSAAFNSSYKPERAVYGAYPLREGKPDEARASKRYQYHAYIPVSSTDSALINEAELRGRRLVAERSASVLPMLKDAGGIVQESASYLSMLRIVVGGRAEAAIGIDSNFDPVLLRHPDLAALIRKVESPIKKSIGYVMFSKKFYAKHAGTVECFWTTSATLRQSEWFKTTRASYEQ